LKWPPEKLTLGVWESKDQRWLNSSKPLGAAPKIELSWLELEPNFSSSSALDQLSSAGSWL